MKFPNVVTILICQEPQIWEEEGHQNACWESTLLPKLTVSLEQWSATFSLYKSRK